MIFNKKIIIKNKYQASGMKLSSQQTDKTKHMATLLQNHPGLSDIPFRRAMLSFSGHGYVLSAYFETQVL